MNAQAIEPTVRAFLCLTKRYTIIPIKKNNPLRSVKNKAIYTTINIVQLKIEKDKKKRVTSLFLMN